jgi:hypothetical protein
VKPIVDGHKLKMKLTDEGYIMAEVVCPFNDDPPFAAPCSIVCKTGEPVSGCVVIHLFGDIGMECFYGEVYLPTINIAWWDDDCTSEAELCIKPVEFPTYHEIVRIPQGGGGVGKPTLPSHPERTITP